MRLLSRKVSGKEPFYMEIACLEQGFAEMVAYCHAYKIMFPDDKEFNAFLDEKAIPILKRVGMATWPRDVLTDMGLRMGENQANFSLKGVSFGKHDDSATDGTTKQPV
jgi:hypothetical protein